MNLPLKITTDINSKTAQKGKEKVFTERFEIPHLRVVNIKSSRNPLFGGKDR